MDSEEKIKLSSLDYYLIINKQRKKSLHISSVSQNFENEPVTLALPDQNDIGQVWMIINLESSNNEGIYELVHAASTLVLTTKSDKQVHLKFGERKSKQLFFLNREYGEVSENIFSIRTKQNSSKMLSFPNSRLICSQNAIIDTSSLWQIVRVKNNDVIKGSCLFQYQTSQMILDLPQSSTKKGTTIIQYPLNNRFNQRWKLIKVKQNGGSFFIQNLASGLYLDIKGAKNKKGTYVIQWTLNGGSNQRWKLNHVGNGYYLIQSAMNQKLYLSVQSPHVIKSYIVTSDDDKYNAWKIQGYIPE